MGKEFSARDIKKCQQHDGKQGQYQPARRTEFQEFFSTAYLSKKRYLLKEQIPLVLFNFLR
jgi:hypothetical protein